MELSDPIVGSQPPVRQFRGLAVKAGELTEVDAVVDLDVRETAGEQAGRGGAAVRLVAEEPALEHARRMRERVAAVRGKVLLDNPALGGQREEALPDGRGDVLVPGQHAVDDVALVGDGQRADGGGYVERGHRLAPATVPFMAPQPDMRAAVRRGERRHGCHVPCFAGVQEVGVRLRAAGEHGGDRRGRRLAFLPRRAGYGAQQRQGEALALLLRHAGHKVAAQLGRRGPDRAVPVEPRWLRGLRFDGQHQSVDSFVFHDGLLFPFGPSMRPGPYGSTSTQSFSIFL